MVDFFSLVKQSYFLCINPLLRAEVFFIAVKAKRLK